MKTRRFKQVGILVVAGLFVGTTVVAQGPFAPKGSPFAAILDKLDQIIDILTTPDTPGTPATPVAGPVRLFTGSAFKPQFTDRQACNIVNVGTATIPLVLIMAKDDHGNVVVSTSLALPSGRNATISETTNTGVVRCEFSFVGFADDVRATLVISDADTWQPYIALDAR